MKRLKQRLLVAPRGPRLVRCQRHGHGEAEREGAEAPDEGDARGMRTPEARFASDLKRWRLAAGLKQEALATALGLANRSSISQWERGINRPALELLPQLAVLLGVSFRLILEAWWGVELPHIATAEGVVLAQRARRLSQRDRQRLTTLIDAWVLPREAVEGVLADELRHLVDVLETRRAEAQVQHGDGS